VKKVTKQQTVYKIGAKRRNPQLSYSDFKIDILGAACRLGFDRKWIVTMYQLVKFQHNRPMRGCVIDDSTNFHGPVVRKEIL